jgi:hypothetical protein
MSGVKAVAGREAVIVNDDPRQEYDELGISM